MDSYQILMSCDPTIVNDEEFMEKKRKKRGMFSKMARVLSKRKTNSDLLKLEVVEKIVSTDKKEVRLQ